MAAQQMAASRQQHEMEQAFFAQQGGPREGMQQMGAMNPMQMQNGMQAACMAQGMSMGMLSMVPRTTYQPMPVFNPQQQMSQAPLQTSATIVSNTDNAWAEKLGQQTFSEDYSNVQTFVAEGQPETSVEEKTKNSEFYTFMDRIRNKEVLIDEEKGELVQGPGLQPDVPEDAAYLEQLAQMEGINMPPGSFDPNVAPQADPYQRDPEIVDDVDIDQWAREYAQMRESAEQNVNRTDYPFENNNPYLHNENALQDGMDMLAIGNLPEAALAFEAVCKKDNDNLQAWKLLGNTQAENEKDNLAIIAFNNARRLAPKDIEVHARLAVSHTNERNTEAAMASLKAWVVNNPEYASLSNITVEMDPDQDLEMTETFFFADPTLYREAKLLYGAAMEMNPNDVNLYINLGVLYNIAHEYDEAAQCLQRAVELNPNDATLWNKLGASYANGSKTELALDAYTHALDINPGYVRAIYNLAIAYSNLSKYSTAAKYFVRAIAAQNGGTNPTTEAAEIATNNIWEMLRMTLNLLDRDDLVQLTYNRNLEPFVKEFGLEGII
ncbi:peroxin-5 [Angomonas deanei]|nr:peroxin-5 [Angomonas deanei]|eukprot:EPY41380.1 peroxin-5 [Angomonas deanei]